MTPVLFLIFNRPEPTRIVFEQIRHAKPSKLFIAADGPRPTKKGEHELCLKTRSIIELIDWDCEVKTLFRTENLGCGKAVSLAIDWFFENVEEGIILEDDCLPNQSFFTFCEEMLRYYKNDQSVMHIGGTNYQNGIKRGDGSYYFSRYAHIWGWATWKNSWALYDYSLQKYDGLPADKLGTWLIKYLNSVQNSEINTWDIQWFMSVWFNKGFVVTPNVSLVKNIGYGREATRTNKAPFWLKFMHYEELKVIQHPSTKEIDKIADSFVEATLFRYRSNALIDYLKKIRTRIKFLTKLQMIQK